MKTSRYTLWMVPCLTLAVSSHAQLHEFDWRFSTNSRTNEPVEISNPSDAIARANIIGANTTYFFGTGPNGQFGTHTGLWDINGGLLSIETDRYALTASTPLDYILTLTHFFDNGAFYPGNVTFSITPNGVVRSVETPTPEMAGSWVTDTYTWNQVIPGANAVGLTISPGTGGGSGAILVDAVQFSVTGPIVPEPGSVAILATGLLAFWGYMRFGRQGGR